MRQRALKNSKILLTDFPRKPSSAHAVFQRNPAPRRQGACAPGGHCLSPDDLVPIKLLAMRTSAAQALLLALFLTGCATGTATRSVSTHSDQNSDAVNSVTPASIEYVELPFGASNYCVFAEGRQIQVESRDMLELSDDLPLNIRMRQAMVDANAKEWKAVLVFAGMDPSTPLDQHAGMVGGLDTVKGMLTYFQASDGIEFLVDNHAMALWYRSVKGPWTCVVSGVNVVKLLGGNYPHLPVCYAGATRFLVAETLPGRIAADQSGPELKAHCATFLIDCGTGRVIERSEAVTYSYNPPLVLPREWKEKYGIKVEPSPSPKPGPPHR